MIQSNETFYKQKKWKRLRESVLMRDGYTCQWCKRFGKRTEADHVHHVFPRELFPEYTYMPWNLISLCKGCHDSMHYRTDRTLTDKGKELACIVARKNFLDMNKIIGSERKEN